VGSLKILSRALQRAAGVYLYQYAIHQISNSIIPAPGRTYGVHCRKGDDMPKGRVKIRLRVTGHGVRQVSIAGEAVTIMKQSTKRRGPLSMTTKNFIFLLVLLGAFGFFSFSVRRVIRY